MHSTFNEKIALIREKIREEKADAVIIGTRDPHQSPSVAPHWQAVQWLTGFSGSLGLLVVTDKNAAFWTDGRYTLQANRELSGTDIHIYTFSDCSAPDYVQWIAEQLPYGSRVLVDYSLLSLPEYRILAEKLRRAGISAADAPQIIDEVWPGRPEISHDPLFEMPIEFAGLSRADKIAIIRERIDKSGADCYLCCQLDSIAWLTNLRGKDNKLYPIFHAYLFFDVTSLYLFTDVSKITDAVAAKLIDDGFVIKDINEVYIVLKDRSSCRKIYIDPFKTSCRLYESLAPSADCIEGVDLITAVKSQKNDVEQENIRKSNIKECTAICRLIKYIKENVGGGALDEFSISEKVDELRKMDACYMQAGNVPIVAVGENAALPHYKPNKNMSSPVKGEGFLLFDLCAHYYTGSTDITRTIQLGPLSEEMRRDYTLTLKSHIALASLTFPYGVTGVVLDGIVKSCHWREHMNYDTGTGHGIGFCLDIHEGPCKLVMEYTSLFPYASQCPLDVGMLFSNEPGVYKKGRYGIRLENDIIVQRDCVNEFGLFLKFETVTYCPFERGAVIAEMLTDEERGWLNKYHQNTYEKLSPSLDEALARIASERDRTYLAAVKSSSG